MKKLTFVFGLLALSSCAYESLSDRVDQKIAQEDPFNTNTDYFTEISNSVEKNPGLTEFQKDRINAVKEKSETKLIELSDESLRIRSLMMNEIVSESASPQEISLLKRKLKENENEKVKIMLSTVDKVNSIMGEHHPFEEIKADRPSLAE